jgi:hypothetical protein
MGNIQYCGVINELLTPNFKEAERLGYVMAGRYRFQTDCGAHMTPVQWALRIRSLGRKDRGMHVTTRLHLVPKLGVDTISCTRI